MSQQPVYYYGAAPNYASPRAFYAAAAPASTVPSTPAPAQPPQAAPRFFNGFFGDVSNFVFGDSSAAPASTAAPAAVQYQGAYPSAYAGGYYAAPQAPVYQQPQGVVYQQPQAPVYQQPQGVVYQQPQGVVYQQPQVQAQAQAQQPGRVNPILRPGVAAGAAALQAGQGVGAAVQAGVAASQQVVPSKHAAGRRKGLLFGVNYPGTDAELRGCVNDVFAIKEALIKYFGFAEKDLEILIDTDPKYQKPTGKNMLAAMKRLAADAKPGDILFMHYSGHGSQVPTRDPGEVDGLDEVLVPCDFDVISDNALKECFASVPSGVNFTFIADCCHSGTMLDHTEVVLEGDKGKDTRGSSRAFVLPNAGSFAQSAQGAPRSVSTETVVKKYLENAEKTRGKTRFSNLAPRPPNAAPTQKFDDVGILITGCQSHQTSMDAYSKERRMMHGALTNALLKTWAKDSKLTYRKLVLAVRHSLFEDRYEQNPSLECNKADADRIFLAPY